MYPCNTPTPFLPRYVLTAGLTGAAGGAITGGVAGYFAGAGGSPYAFSQLTGNALASGTSAEIQGGKFGSGFAAGLAGGILVPAFSVSGSRWANAGNQALIGGAVSEATGGDFTQGAVSGAISGYAANPVNGPLGKYTRRGWDLVGKAWNAPNTAIGLVFGFGAVPFGARPRVRHNAIEFENHPLMGGGAITLGNTIHYAPDSVESGPFDPLYPGSPLKVWQHEIQHTYQGQILGPVYLPVHGAGMLQSIIKTGDTHQANPHEGDIPWPRR
jgi:hypothetical protein